MNFYVCRGQHLHRDSFLLEPVQTTYFTNIESSPLLSPLVFTGPNSSVYTYTEHVIHSVRETEWHLHIRRKNRLKHNVHGKKQTRTPPHSPTKVRDLYKIYWCLSKISNISNYTAHFIVLPEKATYRDYFRRWTDFLVRSITLSL